MSLGKQLIENELQRSKSIVLRMEQEIKNYETLQTKAEEHEKGSGKDLYKEHILGANNLITSTNKTIDSLKADLKKLK